MNDDYKKTLEKLEKLLKQRDELEQEIRHTVIQYVVDKSDMPTSRVLEIGYKKIIREEFGLPI
jgi:hypothetical protein